MTFILSVLSTYLGVILAVCSVCGLLLWLRNKQLKIASSKIGGKNR